MVHETPKTSMEQSFKAGYMMKLDKTLEFHETKFHRVVWALVTLNNLPMKVHFFFLFFLLFFSFNKAVDCVMLENSLSKKYEICFMLI